MTYRVETLTEPGRSHSRSLIIGKNLVRFPHDHIRRYHLTPEGSRARAAFRSLHTPGLPGLLADQGISLLGTTAADANGNWSFTCPNLANGSYAFTATATDLAGNTSTPSSPFTLAIGAAGPNAPVIGGVTSVLKTRSWP